MRSSLAPLCLPSTVGRDSKHLLLLCSLSLLRDESCSPPLPRPWQSDGVWLESNSDKSARRCTDRAAIGCASAMEAVPMEVDESAVDMEVVRSVSFNGFLDVSLVEKDVTVDIKTGRLKIWVQTTAYYEQQRNIRKQNRDNLRAGRDQRKADMIQRGCLCMNSEEDVCRFCSNFVLTAPLLAFEADAWRRA